MEQLTLADVLSSGRTAPNLPEPTRRDLVVGMAEAILAVARGSHRDDGPAGPTGEASRDD